MPSDPPLPTPFVSPVERDRAVARLVESYAHDLIPLDEYERRVTLAYRAESREALDVLTADIAPLTAASAGSSLATVPRRFRALFSNVEQRGVLEVPERLEVRSVFGNVELDLTRARFAPGLVELDLVAVFGNIEIALPPTVAVENCGEAVLGSFELRAATSHPAEATTTVRLTGRAVLGNVEVRVGTSTEDD